MTARSFGPVTFEVAPRSTADVQVFHVSGYVPGIGGVPATFSSPLTVSGGAVSFGIDDGGNADAEYVLVMTGAGGQPQTVRIVTDPTDATAWMVA